MRAETISLDQATVEPINGAVFINASSGTRITVSCACNDQKELEDDIAYRSERGGIICRTYLNGKMKSEFLVSAPVLNRWKNNKSFLVSIIGNNKDCMDNNMPDVNSSEFNGLHIPMVLFLTHGHIPYKLKYVHIVGSKNIFSGVFYSDYKINKLSFGIFSNVNL